ncbi:conserved hypothetical protein [Aspergillus terreus NIH2624]|uniref:Endosomal peripheral membrane protein n=1 Tax=Aspergillus terreus (strain NIH 2624 / FGSC A1156) TaxID=341663 RepID=Q0CR26_ASPTN|nr:uncharacterized protein ATEG_03858 [Aspergillus terreus NIH2624]EAU35660.1 conserved hypothetical protein [Aspergillus terreus NIH2624]
MSSQFLQAELLSLIQESKRKNADLRSAAEESLNELKALPSTSELQISADLARKPKFVDPFILACHTRHAKLAGIGVVCLQRLVASRALPSERLKDVLAGLKETTSLSLDIQLKILQSLPSLLQHYSNDLGGELLVSTLEICATLQASKTVALSSTAAATLQQLIVSTFERVLVEDIKVEGSSLQIGYFAYDALRVLDDLCRLVDGEQLRFLRIKSLSPTFTLELIESVLINSGRLFVGHAELTQVLRTRLMPMIVRYLSERHTFAQTIRVARILLVLLKRHMSLLPAECEMALVLLTHLLEPDGTSPWKRVLCMEVFRGIYAEPGLVRLIYSLYDGVDGRKNILKDHMASLVRLASEKPSLIGVSNRSTVPVRAEHSRSITEEQITLEAGGVAGVIGTTVSSSDSNVPGISSQWSVVRTPYMELLDKTDPPLPPDTYIYSLVLNCIGNFAEGLAKFILPLTVPDLKQRRKNRIAGPDHDSEIPRPSQDLQRTNSSRSSHAKKTSVPLNPLQLESHPQLAAVKICAGVIENCWPAILAACSTFLQPCRQMLVASNRWLLLLQSSKAIPLMRDEKAWKGQVLHWSLRPLANLQISPSLSLSTRNLLCLRALLNLGIALGPTLDQPAWSIILGTLQDTDLLIGTSATKPNITLSNSSEALSGTGSENLKANLGNEIMAVQAASAKMFESTSDYPSDSFEELLLALFGLSGTTESSSHESPEKATSSHRSGRMRNNTRRVSLAMGKTKVQEEEMKFVLEKANEVASANLGRLASLAESDQRAWELFTDMLILSAANGEVDQSLRLRANEVLNQLIFQTMKQLESDDDDGTRNTRQMRNLEALKRQITQLYDLNSCHLGSPSSLVVEIHEQSLETLRSILEQYAETFVDGWTLAFDLISTVFGDSAQKGGTDNASKGHKSVLADSHRLIRVSYKSLQLIASDFISMLPSPCHMKLVDSFSKFALQQQDFNISLTTTSSFWNVSDFLQSQIERFSVDTYVDSSVSEDTLTKLAVDDDPLTSRNSLWLLLLLRIVDVTTDNRSEIRNCAVHTLLRIFDAYGQQLTPKAWQLCLNRVLFRMMEEIAAELKATQNPDELKSWIETTVVTVKGTSDLITNFFETITQDGEFEQSWKRLLDHFQQLIESRHLELFEAVFASLSNALLRVQTPIGSSKLPLQCAWSLWINGHPADREDLLDLDRPNQDAAVAYLNAFQQIYRLYKDDLTGDDVGKVLEHLRLLLWNSISQRYTLDIDRPSDLQKLVIDCMKTVCLDKDDAQADILTCLADYVDSPLTKWSSGNDSRKPTYVAFSKSAIDLLSWYITEFGIKRDVFSNGSLTTVLEHLTNPISQRYEWPGKDREPNIWRKSTTASLDILQVAIPYVEKQYEKSSEAEIARFWTCVVDITNAIASARGYRTVAIPKATILADETFDVAAFHRLKALIIPALGASSIPNHIRRSFACALLRSSFIYLPQRSEIPGKAIEDEPLQGLYDVRRGRTFDPPATSRVKMAYAVIDTLFELASAPSTRTVEQCNGAGLETNAAAYVSLAQSISPYVILRCAVSLKGYIADQPLRGLMPQPAPARRALLHLIRGMVNLQSEPSAIPPPPMMRAVTKPSKGAVEDGHKKHLEWIYPLVVQAVQVAGKERDDGEVLHALGKVLHEVGRY